MGKLLFSTAILITGPFLITEKFLSIKKVAIIIGIGVYSYIIIVLFGVRSWLLLDVILPLVFVYNYYKKKITLRQGSIIFASIIAFSLFLLFSRQASSRTLQSLLTQFSSSISDSSDMWEWRSLRNLNEEMSLIPSQQDYFFGKTFVGAIVSGIPVLGKYLEPSWYETPDRWLARNLEPWFYDNFEGIGYSIVAEAHMNFGLIGGAGLFIVLGTFLSYLYYSLMKKYSYEKWLIYLVFVVNLLFMVRQSSVVVIRPIWALLLTILFLRIANKYFELELNQPTPAHPGLIHE